MLSPDGKKLYYVSEVHGGPANIVVMDLNTATSPPTPTGSPKQLTQHKDDAVRRARLSGNGEWIVYECGGDLWVAGTRDGQARKLAIEVHADENNPADGHLHADATGTLCRRTEHLCIRRYGRCSPVPPAAVANRLPTRRAWAQRPGPDS